MTGGGVLQKAGGTDKTAMTDDLLQLLLTKTYCMHYI